MPSQPNFPILRVAEVQPRPFETQSAESFKLSERWTRQLKARSRISCDRLACCAQRDAGTVTASWPLAPQFDFKENREH